MLGHEGVAYQATQLLRRTVSSERTRALSQAVYYSQILRTNLAFEGLTGGTSIHCDSSRGGLEDMQTKLAFWK